MRRSRISGITMIATLVLMLGVAVSQYIKDQTVLTSGFFQFIGGNVETERTDGTYFTLIDEQANVITKTARIVHVGDEYWNAENKHYRVVKVKKDIAHLKYLGTENIVWKPEWDSIPAITDLSVQGRLRDNPRIAIYHTHTDESYEPTDGTHSIKGRGTIFKVGDVFARKLESLGLQVFHDKTPHDPHDAGAYHRSRRTAVRLLKRQPAIAFDVHRDAVPADVYATQIDGQDVTKIKLVLGRQNQNRQANLEFAKTMKAAMDKVDPKLFEGIFLGRGNYNQDLGPRMMLIEVGSHKNKREEAQKGVALFAEAVPKVLGITEAEAAQPETRNIAAPGEANQSRGSWTGVLWLIGLVVVGGLGFLFVSTGSFGGGLKKLREFGGNEWKNFFGRRVTAEDKTEDTKQDRDNRD